MYRTLTMIGNEIPALPMGRYVHIVMVRETESYALFKTDEGLNVARVTAGVRDQTPITRLTMFKRKQTTPERLGGRELLRRHGLLSAEKCQYNVAFCTECPDCIWYGYAIGDQGSEKSKVLADTAFSISAYDESHKEFTFNAPYEDGTMTRAGETTSRFGEQDHVVPGVMFPAVESLRDATAHGLAYVLGNILRTKRYGAQDTRTGAVANHIVAIVEADGEIFSNLRFTQAIWDQLGENERRQVPALREKVLSAAAEVLPGLLAADGVSYQLHVGHKLEEILKETRAHYQDEESARTLLAGACDEAQRYHATVFNGGRKKGKKGKGSDE